MGDATVASSNHSELTTDELDKNSQEFNHPLYDNLDDSFDDIEVELINEYLVDRNLPDAYQIIKNALES